MLGYHPLVATRVQTLVASVYPSATAGWRPGATYAGCVTASTASTKLTSAWVASYMLAMRSPVG